MNWISVKDKLPPKCKSMSYKDYIVTCGSIAFVCHFMNGEFYQRFDGCGALESVTHWMPLPAPPKD